MSAMQLICKVVLLHIAIKSSFSSQDVVEFSYDPFSEKGPKNWEFVDVR